MKPADSTGSRLFGRELHNAPAAPSTFGTISSDRGKGALQFTRLRATTSPVSSIWRRPWPASGWGCSRRSRRASPGPPSCSTRQRRRLPNIIQTLTLSTMNGLKGRLTYQFGGEPAGPAGPTQGPRPSVRQRSTVRIYEVNNDECSNDRYHDQRSRNLLFWSVLFL
jgi:hypothetical protein